MWNIGAFRVQLIVVVVATGLCLLSVVESTADSSSSGAKCLEQFKSPMKYNISCRYGFKACSNTVLESEFPELYDKSAWRAPAPASVSPEAFCTEDPDTETSRPAIAVTWKLPDDRGASLIRGFDVRVEGQNRGFRCIVVALKEEIKSSGASFSGTITSVEQNKHYVITLQSLPRNNASGMLENYVTTPECAPSNSGSWAVNQFNITYDHVTERLHVAFKGPPKVFGFEEFKLSLWSADYTLVEKVLINQTKYSFENIKPGEYDLMLKPHDPYFQQEGKCKCRNTRDICSSCTISEVKYVAKAPRTEAVTQPETNKIPFVLGGVAAIILVLVILLIIAIIVGRHRIAKCVFSQKVDEKYWFGTQRVMVVFIDVKDEFRKSTTKAEHALEKYKERIRNETDVYVCETVLKSDEKLCSSMVVSITECLCSEGHTMSLSLPTWLIQESGKVRQKCTNSDKDICIVCCLVVSDETSKEGLDEIQKAMTELDKKLKVINVALVFGKISPGIMSVCGDIKCYKIPAEHKTFLQYVKGECARSDDISEAPESNKNGSDGVTITVDFDTKCSQKTNNDTINTCHKTSRMELFSRLDIPMLSRERYVSSDSGKGGSVDSNRFSPLEDNLEASDENENDYLVSEHCSQPFSTVPGMHNGDCKAPSRCPSDVYFAPPEPSEISESDILENYQNNYARAPYGYIPMSNIKHTRTTEDIHPLCGSCGLVDDERMRKPGLVAKTDDNSSMDTIMSKMAAINARSMYVMDAEAKTGETYSVFEGNA